MTGARVGLLAWRQQRAQQLEGFVNTAVHILALPDTHCTPQTRSVLRGCPGKQNNSMRLSKPKMPIR